MIKEKNVRKPLDIKGEIMTNVNDELRSFLNKMINGEANVGIITGRAGTGKTTTMLQAVQILKNEHQIDSILLATTGSAVARMKTKSREMQTEEM